MCLAPSGKAASTSPSSAKNRPSATIKSDIGGPCPMALCYWLALCAWRTHRRRRRRARRGSARCCALLAGRIAEEAEEIAIRAEHHMRVAVLHAALIGLHGAIETEEVGVLAIGVGKDAVALGVALAADVFRLRIGFGEQHRDIAVGPGANFLALLAALGAEFGGFTLPFRLHALIDRLAVLFRKIDAANADVDDLDAERLRVAIELVAHLHHQRLAAVAHRIGERRCAEHAAQGRIQKNRKLRIGALRTDGLIEL